MTAKLIDVSKAAAVYGAGVSTIWKWSQEGSMPKPIKIGGSTRWRLKDIQTHIDQLHQEANAA